MSTWWKFGLLLLPALLTVLVTLTPLAYASLPDPVWVRGVYDDADYDDIVVLIAASVGVVELCPLVALCPTPLFVGAVPSRGQDSVQSQSASSLRPRAPPAV